MLYLTKLLRKNVSPISEQIYTIEEGMELLPFLLATLTNKSRNSVKSILTRGQVSVDGRTVTQHNYQLHPGQTVRIMSNQSAQKKSVLHGIRIIHEDDDLIVIEKDAGVLTVAAKDPTEQTAYRQLNHYVKAENRQNRIFIVHRLDRDTSGILVFAKSEAVKNKLQQEWQDIVKERTYIALVEGVVKPETGTISSWLTESKSTKVYSSPFDNGGKHAITHYKKIGGNQDFTLLEVQLETGRKNQIRVHMQDLGHPIVGDRKYGATTNPIKRLGLHATTLAFVHPKTHKLVRYTAKAPRSFHLK